MSDEKQIIKSKVYNPKYSLGSLGNILIPIRHWNESPIHWNECPIHWNESPIQQFVDRQWSMVFNSFGNNFYRRGEIVRYESVRLINYERYERRNDRAEDN